MRDATVRVRPVGGAWVVEGAERLEPLLFLSGGRAEAQAHAIARSIAKSGGDACVAIHDRSEKVIGTVHYPAAGGDGPPSPRMNATYLGGPSGLATKAAMPVAVRPSR